MVSTEGLLFASVQRPRNKDLSESGPEANWCRKCSRFEVIHAKVTSKPTAVFNQPVNLNEKPQKAFTANKHRKMNCPPAVQIQRSHCTEPNLIWPRKPVEHSSSSLFKAVGSNSRPGGQKWAKNPFTSDPC